jgi:hypothetical protein
MLVNLDAHRSSIESHFFFSKQVSPYVGDLEVKGEITPRSSSILL